MIPAVYLRLDELPRTPGDKIDRDRSPTPVGPTGRTVTEHRRAQTALQQQLIDIWADVLGHTDIGIDDDFFELGGHSLLAAQIVFRGSGWPEGSTCPPAAVFEYPTVDLLAASPRYGPHQTRCRPLHTPEIPTGDPACRSPCRDRRTDVVHPPAAGPKARASMAAAPSGFVVPARGRPR